MKVYLFNPGHDIALAAHQKYVTLPHAARQLQTDLAFLPALWATEESYILVEDKNHVKVPTYLKQYTSHVNFIDFNDLANHIKEEIEFIPWGWDLALRQQLIDKTQGLIEDFLPSEKQLEGIRNISGRGWSALHLLPRLTSSVDKTIGEVEIFDNYTSLTQYLQPKENGLAYQYVLKAPWSSSGRGLRFVDMNHEGISTHLKGWIKNVIDKQKYITAEPYYSKVCDFGMEFYAHKDGTIDYLGLSVFNTTNGAYTGNVLADETQKEKILSRYVSTTCLKNIRDIIKNIMSSALKEVYTGPFGVDMMILNNGYIHPCVELNLRQTMGHVALALTQKVEVPRVMRMSFQAGHYSMHINSLPSLSKEQ